MIDRYLLNEDMLWGRYVLPSVSRDDPAFPDNDYWRGRIWAPMNYLVYMGLKRYGFEFEAHMLAQKSLELFLGEWERESGVYENYNSVNGRGGDVPNSDGDYTWGCY